MGVSPLWLLLVPLALLWWGWRRAMAWFEAHGRDVWDSRAFFRLDGANRLFCYHYHHLKHGPVWLPAEGGAVLVSNHVSGLDPFLLAAATERPLHFLVAHEQYSRWGMRWFFKGSRSIPVERSARPARAFRAALDALARGEVVALFPQGGIHLDSDPPKPLKSGAVRMAQLAGVPLIPLHISGIVAEGKVAGALLPRSDARISTYAPMFCKKEDTKSCLRALEALLCGRPEDVDCPGYDPLASVDPQTGLQIKPAGEDS